MIVEAKVTFDFYGITKNITAEVEDKPGNIKPGDLYVGKRNTGWELGECLRVNEERGYIESWPGPILKQIYSYDIHECRKVKAILFS